MTERLKKQLDFALEIDKEKNIFRQTHLSNHGRNENDAEHAWHMAIMAYLLREYSNEPVDIGKVMLMCLIHDIVEIEAGDTYAYDEEGKKTQALREKQAKEHLLECYLMIRLVSLWHFLRSLKHMRQLSPSLHIPWITYSLSCLTIATVAVIGENTVYLLHRCMEDRIKLPLGQKLFLR